MSEIVQISLALNPNTPVELLITLAGHPSAYVRRNITINSHTPKELLWCLLTDTDSGVYTNATGRLNLTNENLKWIDDEMIKTIYNNLTANNQLNSNILGQILKTKMMLTQTELIELCELYDKNVHQDIKDNYNITHPLLKQILKPIQKPTISHNRT